MEWFAILSVLLGTLLIASPVKAELLPGETAPDCSRAPGALPDPARPAGSPDPANPIRHVLVMMQENHSFDNYLGSMARDRYAGLVDGIDERRSNPDANGTPVQVYRAEDLCSIDPDHSWDAQHANWNHGANDGFYLSNNAGRLRLGPQIMSYYDQAAIPFYQALADHFAIADRYFCSVLGPTLPNRYYLMAGSSFGHVDNRMPKLPHGWEQPTIFDQLTKNGVNWKYYVTNVPYIALFHPFLKSYLPHLALISRLKADLRDGTLPQVAFIESDALLSDEHPPSDIQIGEAGAARHIRRIMRSASWASSALFLTYDENGGFYDHVPPPPACRPDGIAPILGGNGEGKSGSRYAAEFDRYGFRVPFILVSPYARRHFVSHRVYDHTSILAFIESKFNLPALSRRDANADAMLEMFDFSQRDLSVPELPETPIDWAKAADCLIHRRPEADLEAL